MVERWQVTIAPDAEEVGEFVRRFGGVAPSLTGYGNSAAEALADARAAAECWCEGAAALAAAAAQVETPAD